MHHCAECIFLTYKHRTHYGVPHDILVHVYTALFKSGKAHLFSLWYVRAHTWVEVKEQLSGVGSPLRSLDLHCEGFHQLTGPQAFSLY